jgi:hypothetical protein
MRWAGHVAHVRKVKDVYRCLTEKTKGRCYFFLCENPRRRGEDDIKMDIRGMGCEKVD